MNKSNNESSMILKYYKGTILIEGDYNVPNSKWDSKTKCFRAEALHYRDIIEYLENSKIQYKDLVLDLISCPEFTSKVKLRAYQKKAVEQWFVQKKGVVVMPTGSGKTIIAIKIIEKINSPTLIIVPTLNLVKQWKEKLAEVFSSEIGEYTGEKKELKALTVSTYDSAFINAENLGNKYKLLVFDEVHHLPSEGYRQIAEMFASPFRLGLTATFERADGLHSELPRLVGGKICEIKTNELTGKYLANYEIKRIGIPLTQEEKAKYETNANKFKDFLSSNNILIRSANDFKKLVIRSGRDPRAREALLSKNKAERIAYNSINKLEKISELLHKNNRTIIFTKYNDMVYDISKKFFIPCITHKTSNDERDEILDKFKRGIYSVIASSQVLNEGIDVPDANVGVIVSGTGSSREFVQRLGRLLRPKEGKKAILYELVSKGTKEVKTANRRKK